MDERRSGMKIHRVVQMLGATTSTGKLADDMYDLNYKTYYSEAEDKDIPISHMDFQHLVRAFVKQNDQTEKNIKERNFLQEENENLEVKAEQMKELQKKYDNLREAYNVLFDAHNAETSRDTIWQDRYNREVEKSNFWHKAYVERCTSSKGHNYVFSDIPNDCDGQQFTDSLKKYFNKDTYKMRVRGQYLKDEVKESEGWQKYDRGQPIDKSKCLRVYIDKK
jgi:glutamate synthase domain-containing protein 1